MNWAEWLGLYVLVTLIPSVMVVVSEISEDKISGFYKNNASVFGRVVVIVSVGLLSITIVLFILIASLMTGFESLMKKKDEHV